MMLSLLHGDLQCLFSVPSPGCWECQGWSRLGWWADSWSRYSGCHSLSWQAAETWPSRRHHTGRRPHTCRNLDTVAKREGRLHMSRLISSKVFVPVYLQPFRPIKGVPDNQQCPQRGELVHRRSEYYNWMCQRRGYQLPNLSVFISLLWSVIVLCKILWVST